MPRCGECDRDYIYNDEIGCSRELCGPYCDGKKAGRKKCGRALQADCSARILVRKLSC